MDQSAIDDADDDGEWDSAVDGPEDDESESEGGDETQDETKVAGATAAAGALVVQAGAPVVQADAAETFCPGGVYVLANRDNGRTYVGCAGVSFFHRLRQHNREITGGAKATAGSRTWYHALLVTGFTDRRKALSFEWYVKRYKWFEPGAWHGVRRQDPIGRHRHKVELLLQKFGTDKFPGLVLHDVAPLSADVAAGCLCFDCAAAGERKKVKNKGRGTAHGTAHGNA